MGKHIIAVIQQKGGAGKTTTAVNIATMMKELQPKLRIVIADADPQASATKWLSAGKEKGVGVVQVNEDRDGKVLKKELDAIEADVIVLDLPPQLAAVTGKAALYANVLLIPIGPSKLDTDAAKEAVETCKEAQALIGKQKILLIPNRVDKRTCTGRELAQALTAWGPVSKACLGMRTAYSDAVAAGTGVNKYAAYSDAYFEVKNLTLEIITLMEEV